MPNAPLSQKQVKKVKLKNTADGTRSHLGKTTKCTQVYS